MFKAVAAEGGQRTETPTVGAAERAVAANEGPSAPALASRVRELEAQLRQRDEELRMLTAMRRAAADAGQVSTRALSSM